MGVPEGPEGGPLDGQKAVRRGSEGGPVGGLLGGPAGVLTTALGWAVHVLEVLVKGVPGGVAHAVFHRHSHPLHLGCLGQPWRCKVWAHLSN